MEQVTDPEPSETVREQARCKWTHGWVESMILANPLPVQTPTAVWGTFYIFLVQTEMLSSLHTSSFS